LESLYKSVQGEYHCADAAWAYVKRRTGVDLLSILKELAAERTAQTWPVKSVMAIVWNLCALSPRIRWT
jgi:hypothetical protein